MNDIVTIIGSVGFPIVACIFMAVFYYKTIMPLKDSILENTELIKNLVEYIKNKED